MSREPQASNKAPSATCKSSVSPFEAGMNRTSLAVFASDNALAFSTTKSASVDEDFSEPISCSLLPGDYHLVAVIHQANEDGEAAAIASTSQATITTSKLLSVFADNTYQYRTEIFISDMNLGTFQNNLLGVNCLLSEASQHISVTVNMKDASGNIVRTRTFSDVPMEPNRITRATGSFFHSTANSSFILDTTLDPHIRVRVLSHSCTWKNYSCISYRAEIHRQRLGWKPVTNHSPLLINHLSSVRTIIRNAHAQVSES